MGKSSGPHATHRLNPLVVRNTKKAGYYADGGNLYLQVTDSGATTWLFRYRLNGRSRESAQLASEGAKSVRKKWKWCCQTYVADVKIPELSNAKHAAQWGTTLATYTYPFIGDKYVDEIALGDVLASLKPIWLTINETASRVRSRMEAVYGWARVNGYCTGDNPAAWKANLQHLLSAPDKVRDESHHPSLTYEQRGPFMAKLHEIQGYQPEVQALDQPVDGARVGHPDHDSHQRDRPGRVERDRRGEGPLDCARRTHEGPVPDARPISAATCWRSEGG